MDNLVSVIVPVYNTKPYLHRCVQSVLNQTYQNVELILVDDGSTDGSGEACDRYALQDTRVQVIHKSNGGVSSARNTGINQMSGKYFMFLDSDDSLETEALQCCVDAIETSDADAVVFGWQELISDNMVNSGRYPDALITDSKQMIREILEDRHIYGGGYPNKLWRKETFLCSGKMPLFSEELFYVEDMEWVIRMMMGAKQIKVIEPIFYNYHLRDGSASRSEGLSEKRLIGYHDTLKQIVLDLQEYPDLQQWFEGIRYTELINSIIDARIKRQVHVYRALQKQLEGKTVQLLRGDCISSKMKVRLLAVQALCAICLSGGE